MLKIKSCPTCGRRNLRLVTRDVPCNFGGQKYVAPAVRFHECPECGEKLYDRDALRQMQNHRPAMFKTRPRRRSA